jgi:hypothetical protein
MSGQRGHHVKIATVKTSSNVLYVDFASVVVSKYQALSWRPISTTTTSMPEHVNFESSARASPRKIPNAIGSAFHFQASDDIDQILNKLREEMSKLW